MAGNKITRTTNVIASVVTHEHINWLNVSLILQPAQEQQRREISENYRIMYVNVSLSLKKMIEKNKWLKSKKI